MISVSCVMINETDLIGDDPLNLSASVNVETTYILIRKHCVSDKIEG